MTGLGEIGRFWSEQAARFDEEADHGLHAPSVRESWRALLGYCIPDAEQQIVDLGCGTGSLSLLLAEQGHTVIGVDLSAQMARHAKRKVAASGRRASFIVGDAGNPGLSAGAFDVVLCRHLLWTLPDPLAALAHWRQLLRPSGRLVAIEGRWTAPSDHLRQDAPPWDGGVPANTLLGALEPLFEDVEHIRLSHRDDLWGKRVTDERYAVVATHLR